MVDIKLRQWAEQALPAKSVEAGKFLSKHTSFKIHFQNTISRLGNIAERVYKSNGKGEEITGS